MKPVKQAIAHDPAKGINGDCFRAVIASLLELPIEEVPHFIHDGLDDPNTWYVRLTEWLRPRGLAYLEHDVSADGGEGWRKYFAGQNVNLYHAITGPSPRFKGEMHCVVGRNGEVVFDPHPEASGVPSHMLYGLLIHTSGA